MGTVIGCTVGNVCPFLGSVCVIDRITTCCMCDL